MGHITSKPVKAYRTPMYPTKLQVLDNDDLLRRHIPSAWLGNKELAALAGVFLCANTVGCADEGAATSKQGKLTKDAAAVVAPVFEHGKGSRSMVTCIAVTSPVFLSEAEALQIITEELALHGVHFAEQDVELPPVVIPGTELTFKHDWISGRDEYRIIPVERPLEIDLYDPASNIGIEFVCQDDYETLGGDAYQEWTRNIKNVASSVAKEVKNQGKNVCFGVFYDPIPYLNYRSFGRKQRQEFVTAWSPDEEDFTAEAKELLRQQVKDFADWLKGQGII